MRAFLAILCVVILGLSIYGTHFRTTGIPKALNPQSEVYVLPCNDGGARAKLRIHSQITLDKNFLDSTKVDHEEEIHKAIRYQLKYLFGIFNRSDLLAEKARYVLTSKEPKISVEKVEDWVYGSEVRVYPMIDSEDHAYVKKARESGAAHSADGALLATYTAEVEVASCNYNGDVKQFEVLLPQDPYLAYWYVPESKRLHVRFGRTAALVNPCAFQEVAEIPFPAYYWYVWDPYKRGVSEDKTEFDCRDIIQPSKLGAVASVEVLDEPQGQSFVFGQPLKNQKELRFTLIFSPLEIDRYGFDAKLVEKILTEKKDIFESAKDYVHQLQGTGVKNVEGALAGFNYFLTRLAPQLRDVKVKTEFESEVGITIDAKLALSGRPVHFTIFYGPTNSMNEFEGHHWPVVLRGLAADDVIVYVGHAGMGSNFSLRKLLAQTNTSETQLKQILARKKYQIFGVVACDAYSYFGSDFAELSPADKTLDFVMTADSQFIPSMVADIVHYLDSYLSDASPDLYWSFHSFSSKKQSLIFERSQGGKLRTL